jgi:DNA-binding transcriptional LysR family regulator
MEQQNLDAFMAVIDHGGFRSAAIALGISQPAVTRRIQRLEQDLGVRLLERDPRGVRPTGHGEALRAGCQRIRATTDEVRAAVLGAWGQSLVVGASATAAGSYLAPFLSQWMLEHPEVRLMMVEDGALRLRRRLLRWECDVAILSSTGSDEFESLPLTRIGVDAVLPPEHRLASGSGPLSVEDLEGERLLVNGPSFLSRELLESACRVAGVAPTIVYASSVGQTLASLANGGLGIAVLSGNVDLRGFDVHRRPVHDVNGQPLEFELNVSWPRDRRLAPIVYQFARELSEFTAPLRMASDDGLVSA